MVRIDIDPELLPPDRPETVQVAPVTYLDNSHTIEIDIRGINIRVLNSVDTEILKTVLSVLGVSVLQDNTETDGSQQSLLNAHKV